MSRKEEKQFVQDHRITSLGKFAHGYVVYDSTADIIIDRLYDKIEMLERTISDLSKNEKQITSYKITF